MGGYGPMMGWTWLFWLLVVIVLVLLGVIAARGFSGGDAVPRAPGGFWMNAMPGEN